MALIAAPRCDSIKKGRRRWPAARVAVVWLLQSHVQVCRAKIKPARKPPVKSWTARIHWAQPNRPHRCVKPGGAGGPRKGASGRHHRLAGTDFLPLLPTGGEGRGEEATFH